MNRNPTRSILIKTLVRPFYRQNAGFLLFIFLVFFGVVAPSLQLAYHYALIIGMLETPAVFGVVLLAWCIYGIKCSRFVSDTLERPDHDFLNNLSLLPERTTYSLLLEAQLILFLPVSLYSLAITGVALYKGWYGEGVLVQVLVYGCCACMAGWYHYNLRHPGRERRPLFPWSGYGKERHGDRGRVRYWSVLLRSIFTDGKWLYGGIKLFSCGMLYLLLRDQGVADYDLRMPFLIWSLAVFGHGILLYRLRELEERRLSFYKGLPISMTRRLAQYCLLYFLLLAPEILVIGWLTPDPIHFRDAFTWIASAYSLLLLMNSILFVAPFSMSGFLKLVGLIFGILYVCVLAGTLIWFAGLLFIAAASLFFLRYYGY